MNSPQEGAAWPLARYGGRTGVLIVESNDLATVHRWLGQWNPYLDVDLTPVVDVGRHSPERRRARRDTTYGG